MSKLCKSVRMKRKMDCWKVEFGNSTEIGRIFVPYCFVHCEKRDCQGICSVQFWPKSAKIKCCMKYFHPSFVYPIFKFNRNRAYYFFATSSPVLPFSLFCCAVLRFMDRYDPNISLPESGNMRIIPKWCSQKAVWVPFFISIDMYNSQIGAWSWFG